MGSHHEEAHVATTRGPFCCPDVVQRLADFANRSVKPCEDFYLYTCFAFRANNTELVTQSPVTEEVMHSILQGQRHDKASLALFWINHGCIAAVTSYSDDVVTTSLKVANKVLNVPWTSSSASILEAIIRTSSRYQMWPVVKIYYILQNASSAVLLLENRRKSQAKIFSGISQAQWTTAIRLINAHLAVHVSQSALALVHADILNGPRAEALTDDVLQATVHVSSRDKRHSSSAAQKQKRTLKATQLHEVISEIDPRAWKAALMALGYWNDSVEVYLSDRNDIGHALGILTNPRRQPEALAYYTILFAASISQEVWVAVRENNLKHKVSYCSLVAESLVLLWEMAFTHVLTSPVRDTVVRDIFSATLRTLEAESVTIVERQDTQKFRTLLRSIKLQVPSDRIARGLNVSTGPDSYWENILAAKYFRTLYYQFLAIEGFVDFIPKRATTPVTKVVMKKNYIYVPPAVYLFLRFDNGTDPLINTAVVGVQISDLIWSAVFTYTDWSLPTRRQLADHKACMNRTFTNAITAFQFPRLSLVTAVKVSMAAAADWHTLVYGWSLWKITRSQVFYMSYFIHHVCKDMRSNVAVFRNTTTFMTSLRDFKTAFNCTTGIETPMCLPD